MIFVQHSTPQTRYPHLYQRTQRRAPPYGYTGEWWQADIGLLHLRARWYEPASGTFLSVDPVESEPPYQYVRGNVVNRVDPSGTHPICVAALTTGGVVLVLDGACAVALVSVGGIAAVAWYYNANIPEAPTINVADHFTGRIPEIEWKVRPNETPKPVQNPKPVRIPTPVGGPQDPPPYIDDLATRVPTEKPTEQPLTPKPVTPTRTPTPDCEEQCDPVKFAAWWNTLPFAGRGIPGEDWYDYEQRTARGFGTMGESRPRRVPAGTGFVNADGANPNTCMLLDAKYVRDPRRTMFSLEKPDFLHVELVDEFRRYHAAVTIPNGVAGAQPQGMTVITNEASTRPFFENQLQSVGFSLYSNGFVTIQP